MTKKQEVAKKEQNEVAEMDMGWGAAENFDPQDLMLSKIWLMHPLSDMVENEEAVSGELRDSISKELLGDNKTPFEVVVFSMYKTLLTLRGDKRSPTKVDIEPLTVTNAGLPFTGTDEDGEEVHRSHCYNFYVLPVNEIDIALPMVVTMRNTSVKVAKRLMTDFKRFEQVGRNSAGFIVKLKNAKEENKKGDKYLVFDYEVGRQTTNEELAIAFKWYKNLKDTTIKVDDSDLTGETPTETENASTDDDQLY